MMRPRPAGLPSARGAAYLLATAVLGRGPSLQAMLLRELANLIKALHDAHQAMGEVQRAGQIAVAVRTQLPQVTAGLPLADAVRVADSEAETAARLAGQGQAPLKAPRTRPATETARPDRRTDGPGDKTIER